MAKPMADKLMQTELHFAVQLNEIGRTMTYGKALVLLMLWFMSAVACAQPSAQFDDTVEIIRNLTFAQYGEYSLQLDLYRPALSAGVLPVVIVIRGGGWEHGDKETSGPMAAALARRGLIAVSIEYRGASEAVFPAAIHDVKAAVRWLRANAETYGIDPNAIGAVGGSWGGYMAIYAGVTSSVTELEGTGGSSDTSSHLGAVAGLAAPTSLVEFPTSMERYLGESYENNPDLWEFASATTHVSESSPPLLLIAGEEDTTVPFRQSLLMAQAYGNAGAEIEVHLLPDADHTFWQYNEWAEDRVADFFLRHLSTRNP